MGYRWRGLFYRLYIIVIALILVSKAKFVMQRR